ncbi:MAG: hypothetical protein ACFFD2_20085 [Promethearchaeota archaeon]
MSEHSEDIMREEDTTFVETDSSIENQEDTADTAIVEMSSQYDLLNKKIESIIEDFKVGKTMEFKNMMIGIFNLIGDNRTRISELEEELDEIKTQFYRNELTEKDFEEILLLDEEE